MKYSAQVQLHGGGGLTYEIEARSKRDAELKARDRAFLTEPSSKVKRIVVRETVPSVGGGK